jgi:sulfur-carrier protein
LTHASANVAEMATVVFAKAFRRHVECPDESVSGSSVGEVLTAYFAIHAVARGYVVDDTWAIRKHVAVFIGNQQITDRITLSDVVASDDTVYVFQALSGGFA